VSVLSLHIESTDSMISQANNELSCVGKLLSPLTYKCNHVPSTPPAYCKQLKLSGDLVIE